MASLTRYNNGHICPNDEVCISCQNRKMDESQEAYRAKRGKSVLFNTRNFHQEECEKWVWSTNERGEPTDHFDNFQSCTCTPDVTKIYKAPGGKEFSLTQRWYSQSGTIWGCGCGIEDHTGDEEWEWHDCRSSLEQTLHADDGDNIPF